MTHSFTDDPIFQCLESIEENENSLRVLLKDYFIQASAHPEYVQTLIASGGDGKGSCTCPDGDLRDVKLFSNKTICPLFSIVADLGGHDDAHWKKNLFLQAKTTLEGRYSIWCTAKALAIPDFDTPNKTKGFETRLKKVLRGLKEGPLGKCALSHSLINRTTVINTISRRDNLTVQQEQNEHNDQDHGDEEVKQDEVDAQNHNIDDEDDEDVQNNMHDEDAAQDDEHVQDNMDDEDDAQENGQDPPRRVRAPPVLFTSEPQPQRSRTTVHKKRRGKTTGRKPTKKKVRRQVDARQQRQIKIDSLISSVSASVSQSINSSPDDILDKITNPFVQRSVRDFSSFLLSQRCSWEHTKILYKGALIEALFRQEFFSALHIQTTENYHTLFQEYVTHNNHMKSAYPNITSTNEDRLQFGYLSTDPQNPCTMFFCCRVHGWQVKLTRNILKGECVTFYDGFQRMYRLCQSASTPNSLYETSDRDWKTRTGMFSHTMNLQSGEGMLNGKYLIPSDCVGFASFFNSDEQPNCRFVFGTKTTNDGTTYHVARLIAQGDLSKDTLLTANYNFEIFEAMKIDDLLPREVCDSSLKEFILGTHTLLDRIFECQQPQPSPSSSSSSSSSLSSSLAVFHFPARRRSFLLLFASSKIESIVIPPVCPESRASFFFFRLLAFISCRRFSVEWSNLTFEI